MGVMDEFPRFDAAYCPPIPAGWRDESWNNHAMPFWLAGPTTGVCVDYLAKELGAFGDVPADRWRRYSVCEMFDDPEHGPQHVCSGGDLLYTDDWDEVLRLVRERETA